VGVGETPPRPGGAPIRPTGDTGVVSGEPGSVDDDNVCLGCGLCCDGTLFSHLGVLDEQDLGLPLRQLGVRLIVESDPPAFELPCPALADGACTIYHQGRPRACSWFVCDLADAVAAGRTAPADARATIASTKALRDRVAAGEVPEQVLRDQVVAHFRRDAGSG
jgi:uncharacterized protein